MPWWKDCQWHANPWTRSCNWIGYCMPTWHRCLPIARWAVVRLPQLQQAPSQSSKTYRTLQRKTPLHTNSITKHYRIHDSTAASIRELETYDKNIRIISSFECASIILLQAVTNSNSKKYFPYIKGAGPINVRILFYSRVDEFQITTTKWKFKKFQDNKNKQFVLKIRLSSCLVLTDLLIF